MLVLPGSLAEGVAELLLELAAGRMLPRMGLRLRLGQWRRAADEGHDGAFALAEESPDFIRQVLEFLTKANGIAPFP